LVFRLVDIEIDHGTVRRLGPGDILIAKAWPVARATWRARSGPSHASPFSCRTA